MRALVIGLLLVLSSFNLMAQNLQQVSSQKFSNVTANVNIYKGIEYMTLNFKDRWYFEFVNIGSISFCKAWKSEGNDIDKFVSDLRLAVKNVGWKKMSWWTDDWSILVQDGEIILMGRGPEFAYTTIKPKDALKLCTYLENYSNEK